MVIRYYIVYLSLTSLHQKNISDMSPPRDKTNSKSRQNWGGLGLEVEVLSPPIAKYLKTL